MAYLYQYLLPLLSKPTSSTIMNLKARFAGRKFQGYLNDSLTQLINPTLEWVFVKVENLKTKRLPLSLFKAKKLDKFPSYASHSLSIFDTTNLYRASKN